MTIISPSILSCDFLNIEKEISFFEGQENLWIHLDVMDGHFVPNLTFGIPIIKQLTQKTSLPLDCHLMVKNPFFHIKEMKNFGLENITYHYEAVDNHKEIIRYAKEHYKKIGISIKPKTNFEDVDHEVLKSIDLILIMSVEPGFGGQSFMTDVLEKVKKAKKFREENKLNFQIQIDGGINEKTASLAVKAGCDNLVAGSYIFKNSPDQYITKVNSLRK